MSTQKKKWKKYLVTPSLCLLHRDHEVRIIGLDTGDSFSVEKFHPSLTDNYFCSFALIDHRPVSILVCVWVVCARYELDLVNLPSKPPPCCWDEPPPCSYWSPRCLAALSCCASSPEAWSGRCNSSSLESMSCTALPSAATSSLNNLFLFLVFFLSAFRSRSRQK
jgi:hypothetical protein